MELEPARATDISKMGGELSYEFSENDRKTIVTIHNSEFEELIGCKSLKLSRLLTIMKEIEDVTRSSKIDE